MKDRLFLSYQTFLTSRARPQGRPTMHNRGNPLFVTMISDLHINARVTSLEPVKHRLGLHDSQDISSLLSVASNYSGDVDPAISFAISGVQQRDLSEIWWSWEPEAPPVVDTAAPAELQ